MVYGNIICGISNVSMDKYGKYGKGKGKRKGKGKGKAIPLQAWTGSEGSRRLRFPDFKTIGT
jgi:hypothetical protein